jgi:hypothetical protein
MATLVKVRRLYYRDKHSIKKICRQTGMARNNVRSWLLEPELVELKYTPRVIFTKLDTYFEILMNCLKDDSSRGNSEPRSKLHVWQEQCESRRLSWHYNQQHLRQTKSIRKTPD